MTIGVYEVKVSQPDFPILWEALANLPAGKSRMLMNSLQAQVEQQERAWQEQLQEKPKDADTPTP